MSTLKVDTLQTTAGAGLYPARAWINQTDGTTINASGNISSLVDDGVGKYTANLSNALPNANVVVFGTRVYGSVNKDRQGISCGAVTTSSFGHGGGQNSGTGAYEDGTYSAGLMY